MTWGILVKRRGACLAAAAMAVALSGCQTTKAIQAMSDTDVTRVGVGKVTIAYNVPGTAFTTDSTPEFRQTLQANIEGAVRACATGDILRDLEISIDYYRRADPAMTVLIGDSNQLRGTASFLAPDDHKLLGKYSINVAESGGGLLGVALMANGNDWMTRKFGSDICTDVLKRPAPDRAAITASQPTAAPVAATTAAAPAAPAAPVISEKPAAKPAETASVPEGTRMSKPVAD